MKKTLFRAIAVATLAILPATAQAVPIVGTLDLTGAVRVTPTSIDWLPQDGGVGFAVVQPTTNGYFTPLIGSFAQELDLVNIPVGVQLGAGISGFETFPGSPLPNLNFILDMIVSCGQASLDPDNECVAGEDSPFRFDEDTEGTTIVLNFRGRVVDSDNPGEISTFTAKFDATFTGLTPEDILEAFVTQGQILTVYSARKITVEQRQVPEIPEPASMLLLGVGLMGAGARKLRKNRAQKQ